MTEKRKEEWREEDRTWRRAQMVKDKRRKAERGMGEEEIKGRKDGGKKSWRERDGGKEKWRGTG